MTPTPNEIAQLAFIRKTDPKLAMEIATAAGKLNDANTRGEKNRDRT